MYNLIFFNISLLYVCVIRVLHKSVQTQNTKIFTVVPLSLTKINTLVLRRLEINGLKVKECWLNLGYIYVHSTSCKIVCYYLKITSKLISVKRKNIKSSSKNNMHSIRNSRARRVWSDNIFLSIKIKYSITQKGLGIFSYLSTY